MVSIRVGVLYGGGKSTGRSFYRVIGSGWICLGVIGEVGIIFVLMWNDGEHGLERLNRPILWGVPLITNQNW